MNILTKEETEVVLAMREGNLKYKIKQPPKPKRIPQTPEQKKARKQAYYIANKEARKTYALMYYQLHKEECKAKQKEYYAKKKQQHLSERSVNS